MYLWQNQYFQRELSDLNFHQRCCLTGQQTGDMVWSLTGCGDTDRSVYTSASWWFSAHHLQIYDSTWPASLFPPLRRCCCGDQFLPPRMQVLQSAAEIRPLGWSWRCPTSSGQQIPSLPPSTGWRIFWAQLLSSDCLAKLRAQFSWQLVSTHKIHSGSIDI